MMITKVWDWKYIKTVTAEVHDLQVNNNRSINLEEWFEVASEVRHAITHNNFIIKGNKTKDWTSDRKKILTKYFYGSINEQGYHLALNSKNAQQNLIFFGEYAFGIFKCFSKVF